MTMLLSNANSAFLPQDTGQLIVRPVIAAGIATQVATVVQTGAASFRVPVISADGSASWVAEGVEIPISAATLTESVAVFRALKALVPVSNEMMSDVTPEIAKIVGDGLARDVAKQLDVAFFGNAVAGAPVGIKSITSTTVSAGGSWSDLDPFLEAAFTAETLGASITSFVSNPVDALALSQLKEGTTSNRALLQPDPTAVGKRVIGGIPLLVSPAVSPGEIWAIPSDRVVVVIRTNVDIVVDTSALFTSDRSAVRCVLRAGWCFPHEAAVIRVTKA